MNTLIPVTGMRTSQSGIVRKIDAGQTTISRLFSLGIAPEKRIMKKATLLRNGPVLVSVGTCEIAIGHAVAEHILVETD